MGRRIRIMILVSVLVSGLALAGCSSDDTPSPPPLQADSPAPGFQLQSLDGQAVSLDGLARRPVMLHFWATWCSSCQAEVRFIQEVFEDEKWADKGLSILVVNLGESPAKVSDFMEGNGLSFPVLLDTELKVAEAYNVSFIPVTYFIDGGGIIKDRKIGPFTSKADIEWRLVNSIIDDE